MIKDKVSPFKQLVIGTGLITLEMSVLFMRWNLYLSFKKSVLEQALDVIYSTARKDLFAYGYWYDNKYLNIYFKRVSFAFEFNHHMVDSNH